MAARCLLDTLTGRNALIVRKIARTLRSSCFAEIQKCMARFGLNHFFQISKSDMSVTSLTNGAQILFLGLDDVEKIKSVTPQRGALTDIWVEETTETRREDIKQLEKRLRGPSRHTKRLTLSFNPVSRGHWLFKEYFAGFPEDKGLLLAPDLLILRTTYRDNRFLTADDVRGLENEKDGYFHQVYTKGEWGAVGGSVLTNWECGEAPLELPVHELRCGLDFGFAHDPAALVLARYDKKQKRLYIIKEFKKAGLTNDLLAREVLEIAGKLPVICDSSEPKSIAELRRHGVLALPAKKGPDSVLHGLQWLNQQRLIIPGCCPHFLEEAQNYTWTPDGQGGHINRPQGEDHLLDALRYATEQDALYQGAQVISRLY